MSKKKLAFVALPYKGHPKGREVAIDSACKILKTLTKEYSQNNTFVCLFLHDGAFLDDAVDAERSIGVKRSVDFLEMCDEFWIQEADLTLKSGISPWSALFDETKIALKWQKRSILFQVNPTRILRSPSMRIEQALEGVRKLRQKKE